MYGDEPGNIEPDLSDSDISVARPVPKNNTPVAYDSSSEDGVLNDRIAKRREEAKKSGNATSQRRSARAKHILSRSPTSSPSSCVQPNIQTPKKKTKLQVLAKPTKPKKKNSNFCVSFH